MGLHATVSRVAVDVHRHCVAGLALKFPAVRVPVVIADPLRELSVAFLVDVKSRENTTLFAGYFLGVHLGLGVRLHQSVSGTGVCQPEQFRLHGDKPVCGPPEVFRVYALSHLGGVCFDGLWQTSRRLHPHSARDRATYLHGIPVAPWTQPLPICWLFETAF